MPNVFNRDELRFSMRLDQRARTCSFEPGVADETRSQSERSGSQSIHVPSSRNNCPHFVCRLFATSLVKLDDPTQVSISTKVDAAETYWLDVLSHVPPIFIAPNLSLFWTDRILPVAGADEFAVSS